MRITLTKRFYERDAAHVALVVTDDLSVSMGPEDQPAKVNLSHLNLDQHLQLMMLLERYRPIFDPNPGFKTVVQHTMTLRPSAKLCRQGPYRLPTDKTRWVNTQIVGLVHDLPQYWHYRNHMVHDASASTLINSTQLQSPTRAVCTC